jgi:hypothetical protein
MDGGKKHLKFKFWQKKERPTQKEIEVMSNLVTQIAVKVADIMIDKALEKSWRHFTDELERTGIEIFVQSKRETDSPDKTKTKSSFTV